MLLPLLLLNSVGSFLYIVWAINHAKRFGSVLTAFLTSLYVATNGAFLWANQDAAINYGYIISDAGLLKAAIANILFISLAVVITNLISTIQHQQSFKISSFQSNTIKKNAYSGPDTILLNFLLLVLLLVELRYLLFGGGLSRLTSLNQVQGRDSLYNLRYDEAIAIAEGSGLFSSLLAMRILYPVLAVGFAYKIIEQGDRKYIFPLATAIAVNLAMTLSTLQRSPTFNLTLVTFLSFGAAWASKNHLRDGWTPSLSPMHLVLLLPVVLVGSGIYAFTEQVSLFEGLYQVFERIFLISSFSSTSYYDLFGAGNSLPFAGWSQTIGYPVESNGSEITYRDVGAAANGWAHNLNASFVATAYGAAGWPGLIVVSALFLLLARFVDMYISRAWPMGWMALISVNVYVAFEVSNGPLVNGIYAGLGSNAFLLFLLFRGSSRSRAIVGAPK